MTPWTAALAAGLAAAILLQSEPLSRARVWMGRALPRRRRCSLRCSWPNTQLAGRRVWIFCGSPKAFANCSRFGPVVPVPRLRWRCCCWRWRLASPGWIGGGPRRCGPPASGCLRDVGVAVLAYFFGAFSLLNVGTSNGMSILTALSVAWLAAAASIARTDRQPVAWLLARPDRAALVQLAGVFAGAPLLTALVHGLAWRRGINEGTAWVVAVLLATAVSGSVAFFISERDRRRRQEGEAQLRSIMMHAPNAIAIRSVDHGYEFANRVL